MVVRVLRSLQVSPSDLKRYESQATARKEAWLVGVADPTDGQIPEGHVFVSHGSEKMEVCGFDKCCSMLLSLEALHITNCEGLVNILDI